MDFMADSLWMLPPGDTPTITYKYADASFTEASSIHSAQTPSNSVTLQVRQVASRLGVCRVFVANGSRSQFALLHINMAQTGDGGPTLYCGLRFAVCVLRWTFCISRFAVSFLWWAVFECCFAVRVFRKALF